MEKENKETLEMEEDFYIDITDEDIEYVIKAYNNEKRSEDKQMKVVITPLSAKDIDKLQSMAIKDIAKELSELDENEDTDRLWRRKYRETSTKWEFILKIKEIHNFKFKNRKGEIIEIKDAKTLYDYKSNEVSAIVKEIEQYIKTIDNLNIKN